MGRYGAESLNEVAKPGLAWDFKEMHFNCGAFKISFYSVSPSAPTLKDFLKPVNLSSLQSNIHVQSIGKEASTVF